MVQNEINNLGFLTGEGKTKMSKVKMGIWFFDLLLCQNDLKLGVKISLVFILYHSASADTKKSRKERDVKQIRH